MQTRFLCLVLAFLAVSGMRFADAATTAFTYQGKLTDATGAPLTGSYDLEFRLYDAATAGAQIGATVTLTAVSISGGLLSVQLDFGSSPFAGGLDRWLEIAVRPSGSGGYTSLSPRTKINSVPYASYAATAASLKLPFSPITVSSSDLLSITNSGTGKAGRFVINNNASTNDALMTATWGPGRALYAESVGLGGAGHFANTAPDNSVAALSVSHAGSGPAIQAIAAGKGLAGEFGGKIRTTDLQVTNGASAGKVLTSDASGNATWQLVAPASISTTGADYDQVLCFNGTSAVWGDAEATGLTLPMDEFAISSSCAFSVMNAGLGSAGSFIIDNLISNNNALHASTNGYAGTAVFGEATRGGTGVHGVATGSSGAGGRFEILSASNSNTALYAGTTGAGKSAHFRNTLTSGTSETVFIETNGMGDGLKISSTNTSNNVSGIYIEKYGGGAAIAPSALGTGIAVSAFTHNGRAGVFNNASSTNSNSAVTIEHSGSGTALDVRAKNSGWAARLYGEGQFSNGVYVSVPSGRVGLQVASGTKNAVVPTSDGARLMYTEESSEVWFTDYGFGRLENGRATITIDPKFAETVDLSVPYHVFVQANDFDIAGLGVGNKTSTSLEVRELQNGTSNAEFSYRIVAKRKGYETDRMERSTSADHDPNLFPAKADGR